ncbi:ankyrin repeat domain-containing protein [Rhodoferax koreense]|uniref:ankyrin repeat domain-containing protein n=1 Tax=Rhodoferax koreensis TaxID=1842727 RepID=UPI0012FFA7C7
MKKLLLRTALSLACVFSVAAVAQGANTAPLMQAAGAGEADKVSALLAKGADPDARDANGQTALMLAASAGHYETVRRLLIGGANKQLQDPSGKTALDLATEHHHVDLIALMREAS